MRAAQRLAALKARLDQRAASAPVGQVAVWLRCVTFAPLLWLLRFR